MAKYKEKTSSLIVDDSTLRKLKTTFEDETLFLTRAGTAQEARERVMSMDFKTLRGIVKKLSIVNMCINCREQQVNPFLSPATSRDDQGFIIYKKGTMNKHSFKINDKKAMELMEMFNQTGIKYDPEREDDLIDFGKMLVREVLSIDQVAIELQRNRRGEVAAFWLVDGATIYRCFEHGFEGNKKIKWVQMIDSRIEAAYTRGDLIFDYMYKRADIVHRGYGYSLLEQAIDLVTTLILGISYNRDLFLKDKIPKGFLALQGEADSKTIKALQRYWYYAMSGAGAKFNIPILPSGKEGVSLDFKQLGQTNRDIEYQKLMNFFLSLFAGVFGIDVAELGIKTDTSQAMMYENLQSRQEYSKDRGLKSLLAFLSSIFNKILRKIDEDYVFEFVGVDPEDEAQKYETQQKAIKATMSINDLLERDGLPKKKGEMYDLVLDPGIVQIYLADKAQESQEKMQQEQEQQQGQEEGGEDNWDGNEDEDRTDEEQNVDEEVEKAIKDLEEHTETLIKAGHEIEVDL